MLPFVFRFLNTRRSSPSSHAAGHTPCPSGAFSVRSSWARSQLPPAGHTSLCTAPPPPATGAFASNAQLFSQSSRPPCRPLPGCLYWDGTGHLKLNISQLNSLPFSPIHSSPVFSISGVASSCTWLPKAWAQCLSTFIHPLTTPALGLGLLPKFSFICLPYSSPWPWSQYSPLLSSLQWCTLPSQAPTPHSAHRSPRIVLEMHIGSWKHPCADSSPFYFLLVAWPDPVRPACPTFAPTGL